MIKRLNKSIKEIPQGEPEVTLEGEDIVTRQTFIRETRENAQAKKDAAMERKAQIVSQADADIAAVNLVLNK